MSSLSSVRLLCNADGLAVEIEPDEPDRHTASARPAPDRPQQIALAAADVDKGKRSSLRRALGGAAQPVDHRPMPQHRPVEAGQVAQHQCQFFRACIGAVEPFGFGATPRQIARGSLLCR